MQKSHQNVYQIYSSINVVKDYDMLVKCNIYLRCLKLSFLITFSLTNTPYISINFKKIFKDGMQFFINSYLISVCANQKASLKSSKLVFSGT